jgi:NAD+ synthase
MSPQNRINHIKTWITSYISEMDSPANCLVVGVSGGIDSAVVSTICAETGFKTLAVSMPIMQRPELHDLSIAHTNWLTNKYKNAFKVEIDLTRGYIGWEDIMREYKFKSEDGFANSKSRFRMLTLYQIAASTSGLVIGTGNKVEDFGVGFLYKVWRWWSRPITYR